jgi:hypothetical protein
MERAAAAGCRGSNVRADAVYESETRIFEALADLMQIPKNMREGFFDELDNVVENVRQDWYPYPKFSKARDPGFRNAELAVRKARDAINELSAADRKLAEGAWYHHLPHGFEASSRFDPLRLGDFEAFLGAAADALAGLTGRNTRAGGSKGHRAKGDVKDWRFSLLMRALFSWPARFGGRMPFDPKEGGGRKFKEFIVLLRSLVPPGVIPAALPLSTIRDIRESVLLHRKAHQSRR